MAVSKRKRFEVFKRDGFTCQYCGGKPPAVVLECDHIEPKSKGGDDDIGNLITACFDCNRGKGDVNLEVVPESMAMKAQVLLEQRQQLKAYHRAMEEVKKEIAYEADRAGDWIDDYMGDLFQLEVSDSFRSTSLRTFARRGLDARAMIDAWDTTLDKFHLSDWDGQPPAVKPQDMLRYFCGVCWGKIRDLES